MAIGLVLLALGIAIVLRAGKLAGAAADLQLGGSPDAVGGSGSGGGGGGGGAW